MRAKIMHQCAPVSKRAAKRMQYEAEDISIEIDMPFVPSAGMVIKVTPDGDFMKVHEVYWDIDRPDIVQVWTEQDERLPLVPWPVMKAAGWKLE